MENDISRLLRDYALCQCPPRSTTNRMLVKRAELLLGRGDARAAEAQWLDIVEEEPMRIDARGAVPNRVHP